MVGINFRGEMSAQKYSRQVGFLIATAGVELPLASNTCICSNNSTGGVACRSHM